MSNRSTKIAAGLALVIMASAGLAPAQCPEPWVDVYGINTEPDGSGLFSYEGGDVIIETYFLLWGMTAESLCVWEANFETSGYAYLLDVETPYPSINACIPPDYCVGLAEPLFPTGDVALLATMTFLVPVFTEQVVYLHPVDSPPGSCLRYAACGLEWRDAGWASDGEDEPVFFFHPEDGPVAGERTTWSGLKDLYR